VDSRSRGQIEHTTTAATVTTVLWYSRQVARNTASAYACGYPEGSSVRNIGSKEWAAFFQAGSSYLVFIPINSSSCRCSCRKVYRTRAATATVCTCSVSGIVDHNLGAGSSSYCCTVRTLY